MDGRRGFTLLEVVIALVIAVIAAAALYRAVGTGMRATSDAAMTEQALVRAKSHLAAAADGTKLLPGQSQGDDGGGFRWFMSVTPVQTAAVRPLGLIGPRAQSSLPVVLYRITAGISWRDGDRTQQVVLQTERVGGV